MLQNSAIRFFTLVTVFVLTSALCLHAQNNPINKYITDGFIQAVAKTPSYFYFGGQFTSVGLKSGYGLKFTTGSPVADTTFPLVDGEINAVVADGTGGWYIGGTFTKVGTASRTRLARINGDGSVHPWNPIVNGTVKMIYVNGNDLFIGGTFSLIGTVSRSGFAKLSAVTGLADTSWVTNMTSGGHALTMLIHNSDIYVGGQFSNCAGQPRNNAAKINLQTGVLDSLWKPNPLNIVTSLALFDTSMIIGGNFTFVGGLTRTYLAKLNLSNGNADASWIPNPNGVVSSLLLAGTDLYVAGVFSTIGGQSINGLAKMDAVNGQVTPTWNPNIGGSTYKMAIYNGVFYVAGAFSSVGGQAINGIAKLNPTTGDPLPGWNIKPGGTVSGFDFNGDNIYIGGLFTSYNAFIVKNLARLHVNTGDVDTSFHPNPSNYIRALTIHENAVYVAGDFTIIEGLSKTYMAKIIDATGRIDPTWGITISGLTSPQHVNKIFFHNSSIYISGLFDIVGGMNRKYAAKLNEADQTTDASWIPNPNGIVKAINAYGDKIYLGGDFFPIGGKNISKLARVDTLTGAVDTTWVTNPNGQIETITISGTDMYIGGAFTSISLQPKSYLVKFSAETGIPDFQWGPQLNSRVFNIVPYGNSIFISGFFSNPGGVQSSMLARLDKSTGAVNPGWQTNCVGVVMNSIVVSNDTVYAGGWFTTVNDQFHPYLAVFPIPLTIPPTAQTGTATGITNYQAEVNGSVNPNGFHSSIYFDYGTSASYGMRTDTVDVGSGTTSVPISKSISGLTSGTQYHYRLVAISIGGTSTGSDSVFTTLAQPAPVVVTLNTDSIAILSARFNGTVNPEGDSTRYYFEYTGASVTKRTDTVFVGSGSVVVSVNKYITGLSASSNYSVKLVAYNSAGSTDGNTIVFKTKAYRPQAFTTAATQVTTSSGVVNGTVDASGDSSYYYFEYGTTSSFGSVTDTSSAGNGGTPLPRSKTITQLQPGVRYYYRIVAYNSGGKAVGLTSSFVTGASSLLIMTSPVGGEGFEPMTEHEITWTSQAVDSVKIEFSSNDGSSWSEVINSYPAAGGSYIWNIPTGGTTQGRIQISSKGITPALTTTGTGVFSIGSSSFSGMETGTGSDINGTSFSGNNDGTMVGDSGLILNTSDGGSNWSPQSPALNREEPKNLNSVSTPSSSTRFAVGDQGTILRTTNGGTTWSGTTLTDNDYHAVSFSDTLYGTIVGSNGVIQRTTDRGVNWSAQTSGTVKALRDLYLSNQTHGSVVGDEGTILFSSNGGGTWSMQNSGTAHNLNGVYFIKNAGLHQIGYAVGDSGVILKTTNGGSDWVQKTSNTRKNLKSLSFFDAQKGTVAGEAGLIMRTSNGGEAWVAIVNPGNSNFSRVAMAEGGVATYVAGSGGTAYKDTLGLVPVELTSFTSSVKNGEVTLQWTTATETNNAGFEVERASNKEWTKVGYVEGKGTTTEASSYIYTQNNVNTGTYLYRLKQIDFDGKYSYSPEIEVTIAAPMEFVLNQNYPNPFNPSTLIKYQLPEAAEVTLKVYDIQGRQVASLINQKQEAGYYSVNFEAGKLSSGVYIYRLEAGANRKVMKMILIK